MNGAESSQRDLFVDREGDEWFKRNRSALEAAASSPATDLFASFLKQGDKVIEIGCANGARLNELVQRTGCRGWGVDPSAEAIDDGRRRYPELTLSIETADQLSFPADSFEAVVFGFCLYLVDRSLLPRAVAEARRVLVEGGFVLIHDFDPPIPSERPYHHVPGAITYKMDYSRLFTDSGEFVLVEKRSFSHVSSSFHPDPDERVGAWVLHNEPAQR